MKPVNRKEKKRKYGENGFEAWGGYMNAKITKLEQQFKEDTKNLDKSEKLSNIFEGVAIFVNGYTEPSSEDLRLLMLLHGGTFHHYYNSEKTTHVIASNLPNAKMMQLKTMKVVKPEWIVKSIEAKRLLDYKNFLLFARPSAVQGEIKFYIEKRVEEKANLSEKPQHNTTAKTAVDAQFLSEFYNNSRLHHLSTMGAMFKQYVTQLKEKSDYGFPGRKRIMEQFQNEQKERWAPEGNDKVVMHIDMDCFFVSVALRNHPELRGKPIAVAHARGNATRKRAGVDRKFEYEFYKKRMEAKVGLEEDNSTDSDEDDVGEKPWYNENNSMSELASCSYEARKAGVRNGMYLGAALKLCPDLKVIQYDFEGYKEVSYTLYNTVAEYTLDIEAVSCDELFIDCTSLLRQVPVLALDFSTILRNDILQRTGCPSSVGIGANKLQARLATKRAKPNGQFHLQPGDVMEFMSSVEIWDLPGVGRTMGYKLKALGVRTCLDLQTIPLATLKKEFGGKTGETLYKHCRGMDDRVVNSTHQRKSVSAEVNYGIRFTKDEEAITFLKQLSSEVSNRLKEINMKGRHITFKVMIRAKDAPTETAKFLGHGACDYTTRSTQLPTSSNDPDIISKYVINMYKLLSVPACEFRGIGIQITKLESCKPVSGRALESFFKTNCDSAVSGCSKTEKRREEQVASTSHVVHEKYKLSLSQIDRSVLNSLPNDLRQEILSEYGISDLTSNSAITTSSSQNDSDVPNKNIKEETQDTVDSALSNNKFIQLTVPQMRTMISEWVASEEHPTKFDTDMLNKYVQELVRQKEIEDLNIILKCFQRHIRSKRKGNPYWRQCYDDVVRVMQSSMKAVFGKELFIEEL